MKSDDIDSLMTRAWLYKPEAKRTPKKTYSKSSFTKVCDRIKATNIKYGRIGRVKA